MAGAQGGIGTCGSSTGIGGKGAQLFVQLNVKVNEILQVNTGGMGGNAGNSIDCGASQGISGYNDGGTGGGYYGSGGGGGSSSISINGNKIIIAGGGGGGYGGCKGCNGGNGGYPNGYAEKVCECLYTAGMGGNQSFGGKSGGYGSTSGRLYQGGNGNDPNKSGKKLQPHLV